MKTMVAILAVVGAAFIGWRIWEAWDQTTHEKEVQEASATQIDPRSLLGVPQQLEAPLDEAYKKGAVGLKDWLEKAKRSPQIKDPRLAWIELDYLSLIYRKDPGEAKRIFADVKQRTSPQSPIYRRIQAMEKTLE